MPSHERSTKSSLEALEGSVRTSVVDGVGTIEFAHPKGNSLPAPLLTRLAQDITKLGEDPAARVIVLRSGGTGAFCAGASFDEFTSIADASAGKEFFSGFSRVILAMVRAPKFVLTRVHGRAAGGGLNPRAGRLRWPYDAGYITRRRARPAGGQDAPAAADATRGAPP